jgi:hypothetical protein
MSRGFAAILRVLALDSPRKVYQVKSLIITLLTDFGTGD